MNDGGQAGSRVGSRWTTSGEKLHKITQDRHKTTYAVQ